MCMILGRGIIVRRSLSLSMYVYKAVLLFPGNFKEHATRLHDSILKVYILYDH